MAHKSVADKAFEVAEKVLFFLGSANKPRTIENPFSYGERWSMVAANLEQATPTTCRIYPLNDYIYDDERWKKQIDDAVGDEKSVCIIGGAKGEWYMSLFPEYDHVPLRPYPNPRWVFPSLEPRFINATDVRNAYFLKGYDEGNKIIKELLPEPTMRFLKVWRQSKWFGYIQEELKEINKNKEKYGVGPFNTCDNVIVQNNHILLIKRKNHPGKGLYAIPGGFREKDETDLEGSYRELLEETKANISYEQFLEYFVESKIFDHPSRSVAARIITAAHYIHLPWSKRITNVEGADDAASAFWFPIADLESIENLFYDDHIWIINFFIKYKEYFLE